MVKTETDLSIFGNVSGLSLGILWITNKNRQAGLGKGVGFSFWDPDFPGIRFMPFVCLPPCLW